GGDRSFDLYINDTKALTFTTHHNTKPGSWSAAGADSTKLVFEFNKMDRHGDAHGFAHLRVPRKYITLGQPVKLKVVGHAQDSPDWFMTFRYTFEEKLEVEALPFTPAYTDFKMQSLLFTAMHFGGPTQLEVWLEGAKKPVVVPITNGLNVFEERIDASRAEQNVPIQVRYDAQTLLDTVLLVKPVIHRDIHLIHHSHNDIGYSHLQSEVEVIQNNNIWKALELIDRTKDYPEGSRFVWNVESLWAVENFLGKCSETDKQRFIAAVKAGNIALSANYANILTGLCTPEEMRWIVEYADSLRKWYDLPINSAMQTDIPGMSWSMADAYAAHGIRYLSQGPNYIPDLPDGGDRIGSTLREQGDKPYWWKGTTGRDSILVWTAGQGYGGWHGYTAGAIKERGTRKIAAYMNELAAKGYPYDMVQWRYNIVSDNGPVDSTLSDFVREWNEKYASCWKTRMPSSPMLSGRRRK
ncbi:MAG TPA: glycoside hydrolase, partial [Flavobacteriales bacterium]|nr:glycoside hydrolase [Flavobacteriales bacterium]